MKINGFSIESGNRPYVIAELSANHGGSLETALKSLKVAKDCGADAVKLQTYTADTMTLDSDKPDFVIQGGLWDRKKLYDLYKSAETPYSWHKTIFEAAKEIGITVFSTPFDEIAVEMLEELNTPAYKIASFEIVDLPLIAYVASKGKPMIISTGTASEMEIQEAVETARSNGCKELVILHCVSSYPAPVNEYNLLQIPLLEKRFNTMVGLSDHTLGTTVSVASVAVGAVIIEKHFILNKKIKSADSEFSLEPIEFKLLCDNVKIAWQALGQKGFNRQDSELNNRIFRRSLYFVKDIERGQKIKPDDIRRIRPGFGIPPKFFNEIIGRKVKNDVESGTPVSWDILE